MHTFKAQEVDLNDYGMIDTIRFKGGPIDDNTHTCFRRTIEDGKRGSIQKRQNNDFSDSSSDEKPSLKKNVSKN